MSGFFDLFQLCFELIEVVGILVDLAESPVRRNLLPQADQTLVRVVLLGLLLLLLRGQLGPSQCVLHCFSEVEMFSILMIQALVNLLVPI